MRISNDIFARYSHSNHYPVIISFFIGAVFVGCGNSEEVPGGYNEIGTGWTCEITECPEESEEVTSLDSVELWSFLMNPTQFEKGKYLVSGYLFSQVINSGVDGGYPVYGLALRISKDASAADGILLKFLNPIEEDVSSQYTGLYVEVEMHFNVKTLSDGSTRVSFSVDPSVLPPP